MTESLGILGNFLTEATPEARLELLRKQRQERPLVAMADDGTHDAPAPAQADVALAANIGTLAAEEAGTVLDLDSNPIKLTDIVSVGNQTLMTHGEQITFGIANDAARYFPIIPVCSRRVLPPDSERWHDCTGCSTTCTIDM